MDNCIFCKIANHQIPSFVLYEDDMCMAFLDLSQATDGHTLVIPKVHFDNVLEVDEKTLSHMMSVTQKIALRIQEKMNAKGFNIITNMNEVAGQSVQHFHIHIIPRYQEKEGFYPQYTDRSNDVDLESIFKRIHND